MHWIQDWSKFEACMTSICHFGKYFSQGNVDIITFLGVFTYYFVNIMHRI